MIQLKVIPVGNSLGVILPKELLAKLGVEKGGCLTVTDAAGGDVRLSAYSEDVAQDVELGEAFMDRYRNVLRALAK